MKYLVSKYNLPDHWYPSDIKQRARIDEYLHWHGGNLRIGAAWYIFNKVSVVMAVHFTSIARPPFPIICIVHCPKDAWK